MGLGPGPTEAYLQLGDLVSQLSAHALSLVELDLQLLQLGLHLLAPVLRVSLPLQQGLHLIGQLPPLALQGLLRLFKGGLHLREEGRCKWDPLDTQWPFQPH